MKNAYLALKQKHQEQVNNFPMVFAFSDKQFEEAMEKLGLTKDDTDKVFSLGHGGIMRKTDSEAFSTMFTKHAREMKEAIESDTTGEGFILDMFVYELANHEFSYTWETQPTLDALDLTFDDVNASKTLKHGLRLAKQMVTS